MLVRHRKPSNLGAVPTTLPRPSPLRIYVTIDQRMLRMASRNNFFFSKRNATGRSIIPSSSSSSSVVVVVSKLSSSSMVVALLSNSISIALRIAAFAARSFSGDTGDAKFPIASAASSHSPSVDIRARTACTTAGSIPPARVRTTPRMSFAASVAESPVVVVVVLLLGEEEEEEEEEGESSSSAASSSAPPPRGGRRDRASPTVPDRPCGRTPSRARRYPTPVWAVVCTRRARCRVPRNRNTAGADRCSLVRTG